MATFEVIGNGQFPMDMLRYDECWPARTEDGVAIGESWFYQRAFRRRIRLQTCNRIAPTVGRWESFGWRVVAAVD